MNLCQRTRTGAVLLAVASLSFGSLSAQAAMDPYIEQALIQVCKSSASNSMIAFSNTLREYRINEQRVFPRLVCNGESLHQFAMSHGADRTAKKIGRFLPGKVTISDMAMIPEEEKLYVSFR
ncbi:DUF3718 domain-containing protein [Shewanella algae]|uniref:DUF3718 domain-containing protein n=1 Tax=Shewanella algae TaxID=38313 RepID=A0A7T8EDQ4_9GAMM|nr:DUF3718 domain-containing protein [Shewanella algae]